MKTPIDFETEVGKGNDAAQLSVIGKFGLAIAVFIAAILIFPNPLGGYLAIVVLALVIASMSVLMIHFGRKF